MKCQECARHMAAISNLRSDIRFYARTRKLAKIARAKEFLSERQERFGAHVRAEHSQEAPSGQA